jgi:hypothetical protein
VCRPRPPGRRVDPSRRRLQVRGFDALKKENATPDRVVTIAGVKKQDVVRDREPRQRAGRKMGTFGMPSGEMKVAFCRPLVSWLAA